MVVYMKVLHIASLHNIEYNGVGIAVPQHVIAQQKYADVALINIIDKDIPNIKRQISYRKDNIIKTLEEEGFIPDIVIFHEIYHIEFCKIARTLRKLQIPYVVVPHGSLTSTAQSKKKLKKLIANLLFFNRFIKSAKAIQYLSKKELENTKFRNNKFIGTNGINMPLKKKSEFRKIGRKLVYIGRFEVFVKGLDLLVEAIKKVSSLMRESGSRLYIYGPNILGRLDQIQDLINKNNVQDIITLCDPIQGKDKEDVLLDADAFIQTSRSEGMPMGILEALSYGLPCIVTEGTTLKELIDTSSAGFGAETNVESIAQKIEEFLLAKNLLLISDNAVKCIEENYTWDKISKDSIDNYLKIIKIG